MANRVASPYWNCRRFPRRTLLSVPLSRADSRSEFHFPTREESCHGLPLPCTCCWNCRRNKSCPIIRAHRDVKRIIFRSHRIYSRCDYHSGTPKCADNPRGMNWPNCLFFDYHLNACRYLLHGRLRFCVINFHLTSHVLQHARDFAFITDCFLIGCRGCHRDRSCRRILQASRNLFSLFQREMAVVSEFLLFVHSV
jgi:hypothetical protein